MDAVGSTDDQVTGLLALATYFARIALDDYAEKKASGEKKKPSLKWDMQCEHIDKEHQDEFCAYTLQEHYRMGARVQSAFDSETTEKIRDIHSDLRILLSEKGDLQIILGNLDGLFMDLMVFVGGACIVKAITNDDVGVVELTVLHQWGTFELTDQASLLFALRFQGDELLA